MSYRKFFVEEPVRTIEQINQLQVDEIVKNALLRGSKALETEDEKFKKLLKYSIDIESMKLYPVDYLVFKSVSELPKEYFSNPIVRRFIPFGTSVGLSDKENVTIGTIRAPGQKKGCNGLGTFGFFNSIEIELVGKEVSLFGRIQRDVEQVLLKETGLIPGEYLWNTEFIVDNDYPEPIQREIEVKAQAINLTFDEIEYRSKYNKINHPKDKLFALSKKKFFKLLENEVQGATAHLVSLALSLGLDPQIIADLDYPLQDPNLPYTQDILEILNKK